MSDTMDTLRKEEVRPFDVERIRERDLEFSHALDEVGRGCERRRNVLLFGPEIARAWRVLGGA